MHFHIIYIMRVNASIAHYLFKQHLLGWCMRMRNRDGIRRVVGLRFQDHAQNPIIIGLGIIQALQDHGTNTIPTAIYTNQRVSQATCV